MLVGWSTQKIGSRASCGELYPQFLGYWDFGINITTYQVEATSTFKGLGHGIAGFHLDHTAYPIPKNGRGSVFVNGHPIRLIWIEGGNQPKKMTGLVHFDAVPQYEVLVVGSPADIDVGDGLINTFDAWQCLYGLKDVRFYQAGQDTKLRGV